MFVLHKRNKLYTWLSKHAQVYDTVLLETALGSPRAKCFEIPSVSLFSFAERAPAHTWNSTHVNGSTQHLARLSMQSAWRHVDSSTILLCNLHELIWTIGLVFFTIQSMDSIQWLGWPKVHHTLEDMARFWWVLFKFGSRRLVNSAANSRSNKMTWIVLDLSMTFYSLKTLRHKPRETPDIMLNSTHISINLPNDINPGIHENIALI